MEQKNNTNENQVQKIANYNDIKSEIRPLDLVLFKGSELISDSIRFFQRLKLGKGGGEYSHVGIVVTKDILDIPELKEGKLYVFESTMSGKLGQNVNNIYGKSYFGSQLRDLDELAAAYLAVDDSEMAFAKLKNNVFYNESGKINDMCKKKFTELVNKYNNVPYELNVTSLAGSLFNEVRFIRDLTEDEESSKKWLFCSELCFIVYQGLELYDKKFNPSDVVPMDFIGFDKDGIPNIFGEPIKFTV